MTIFKRRRNWKIYFKFCFRPPKISKNTGKSRINKNVYSQYTDDGSPRANRNSPQIVGLELHSTGDRWTGSGSTSSTEHSHWSAGCSSGIFTTTTIPRGSGLSSSRARSDTGRGPTVSIFFISSRLQLVDIFFFKLEKIRK